MKTFKEFLSEVARSPQRAAKLATYIADRTAKKLGITRSSSKFLYVGNDTEKIKDDAKTIDLALKGDKTTRHMFPIGKVNKQQLATIKPKKVSTKELNPTQSTVDLDGVLHKLAMGDDLPATVVSNKGKKNIVDGHHRYMTARLRGTKLNSKIISTTKANKKINEEKDRRPLEVFNNDLRKKHGAEVDLSLYGDKEIHIHHIKVPKEKRKQGIGSAIMKDINDYADQGKKRVTLNPGSKDDRHGTTSRNRLIKFYKRHGYVHNKGRNKDFTTSAAMYRDPK